MTDTSKPTMAALVAAIAAAHAPAAPEPPPAKVKPKDQGPKFYNRRKWQYIKRKRKLAHAAKRRNRR